MQLGTRTDRAAPFGAPRCHRVGNLFAKKIVKGKTWEVQSPENLHQLDATLDQKNMQTKKKTQDKELTKESLEKSFQDLSPGAILSEGSGGSVLPP